MKDSSLNDPSLVSTKMARDYGRLMALLGNRGIETNGYPVAFFTLYTDQEISFTCALPVNERVTIEETGVLKGKFAGGLVIKAEHTGGYHDMESVYTEVRKFAAFYN